jgi:hypothetical protein
VMPATASAEPVIVPTPAPVTPAARSNSRARSAQLDR